MRYVFDLKAKREAKNLTQAQLVKLSGEPQWRVSRWESGLVSPNADQIINLARALGCTPGILFTREK